MVKKEANASENFGKMFEEFGSAVAEIFNDPQLKKEAKKFAKSAKASAVVLGKRLKDEEVRGRFRNVGMAAKDFGKNVSDYFKDK